MNTKKYVVGALAVAAIAASLFFLLHKPTEKAQELATSASEALGLRAGEEVARLLGRKGQVALVEMDLEAGQALTAVASVEKFRATLRKQGVSVARTKKIPGGLAALVMGGGISRDDYSGLVEASPKVDAVVTFAGLPIFPAAELHQFQATHPPLVVVDIFGLLKGAALPELIEQKTVAMGFVPLAATEVRENEPKIFERYYRILLSPAK
jgi:hypothetical protein